MHLPPTSQYFVIGSNEHQMADFYGAINAIYKNFGIKIIVQQSSFEPFLDILKSEKDRNFVIFLHSESIVFRTKAITTLNDYFNKSPCNHKVALIKEEQGYDEVGRQIYYSLLGSLNLVYVFSHDGYLKTHGIQVIQKVPIKSTLIPTNVEPIPVELINIQPIILDLNRCGTLDPVLYFIARDFGTCIGQILLPGASTWSLAYFIQCDDSGKNDSDMVKVCLIHEEPTPPSTAANSSTLEPQEPQAIAPNDNAAAIDSHLVKDVSVLNNPEYHFCRELASLLSDLVNFPNNIDICDPLNKANDGSLFPDVSGIYEVSKKYAKLYKEINAIMEKIRDRRAKKLQDSLRAVRKTINVLCYYIKRHSPDGSADGPTKKSQSQISPKSNATLDPKWITDARRLASHQSRTSIEIKQTKKRRQEVEQRDGIISMPLLEPYLDLKWPSPLTATNNSETIHPVIKEYSAVLKAKEDAINSNKRFGL